jgi:hypothetical protein
VVAVELLNQRLVDLKPLIWATLPNRNADTRPSRWRQTGRRR